MITPERILTLISEESGVSMQLLLSARRDRTIARPRQLAMFIIRRERPDMSFHKIGRSVGLRDHKVAMHACGLMEYLIPRDNNLKDLHNRVTARLKQ